MNRLSRTLCILAVFVSATGCIKEDMSDCPPIVNTELTFSYAGDRQEPAMFARMIDRVTLFVFDRTGGQHLMSKRIEKAELNIFQGTELYLPAGDYRIVAWGNAFNDTEIIFSSLSAGRVHAPAYAAGSRITTNDHLYYGEYDITVPAAEDLPGKVTGDIPFRGAHIDMDVYVKSFGLASDPATWPVVEIGNLMPQYDMRMNAAQPFTTTYHPVVTWDDTNKVMAARFQVLRFADDNPITVTVREPAPDNTAKATVILKDHMADNNISVDGKHEAAVSLLIEFTDLGISVTVPDWDTDETDPEI